MRCFALLEVNKHARSGDYDVVIVDCAPTAETLRLLSLPEVLSWYFEKVLPTERRLMRAARPILGRLTDLPLPEDDVFTAAQSIFVSIDGVRELMSDPGVTSARLVVNPEKMVIDEARRTYSYLGLFGYGVDGSGGESSSSRRSLRPLLWTGGVQSRRVISTQSMMPSPRCRGSVCGSSMTRWLASTDSGSWRRSCMRLEPHRRLHSHQPVSHFRERRGRLHGDRYPVCRKKRPRRLPQRS